MPRSRWYCASLSVGYDLVTASFSVADMVCDYLVLLQFYTDGRPVFFALSLVVMLLAHATYACLFTQKYVPDHTTNQHGRIVAVFLAALPVSQFVPLFIYLESLDLPFMRRAMRKCGLRSDQGGGVDQQEGTDPFWVSMREKASAHSGFLAEAVAEAVPQCALQTVAAVLDGELRYLNLVSILLSIAVITSKCWVLSYSLHVPTMCFNAICGTRDSGAQFGARNSVALLAQFRCATLRNSSLTRRLLRSRRRRPRPLRHAVLAVLALRLGGAHPRLARRRPALRRHDARHAPPPRRARRRAARRRRRPPHRRRGLRQDPLPPPQTHPRARPRRRRLRVLRGAPRRVRRRRRPRRRPPPLIEVELRAHVAPPES